MARIVICAENYGGPGTGTSICKLADALSRRGHSIFGKASLSMTQEEIAGMQADLVIGQHKAVGLARTIANASKAPFVMVFHGEKVVAGSRIDLAVFSADSYIQGYRKELGDIPAISTERGLAEFCDIVSGMAEVSAAKRLELAAAVTAEREASASAARETKELVAAQARTEAAARIARNAASNAARVVSPPVYAQSHTINNPAAYPVNSPALAARSKIPAAKVSSEPTVSVIIVAQDDERYVEQTIRNVLSQTYQEIEVIVVDDGSTDATASAVKSVTDPRVMVFRRPYQSGRHAARNLGFTQSLGEFVMFLDAGDSLTSDAIGALVSRIRAASTPGATFGKPTNMNSVARFRWIFASGKISDADAMAVADSIILYRRAAVEAAGQFKPAVTEMGMEAEYAQRVATSASLMFVDTPVGARKQTSAVIKVDGSQESTPST